MAELKSIRITIDAPRGYGSTTWALQIAQLAKRLGMEVDYIGHPNAAYANAINKENIEDIPRKISNDARISEVRRIEIVDLSDPNG